MELKKIHISDIGKVVTGKTPRTSIVENYGGDIPFLTPSDDLSYKSVPKTGKTLTEQGLNEVKNCLLPPHSVCVSCIGTDLGKVVMTSEPTITNQQFNSIIPNRRFDADFVYYLMTLVGKELNYLSKTSTAVPIINKSSFSNYEVEVPDLETQEKIASILSSLDSKIELNRRINDNLEAMAKQLYDYWFVQFDFPNEEGKPYKSSGGAMVYNEKLKREIPQGWNDCKIKDFMRIFTGKKDVSKAVPGNYKFFSCAPEPISSNEYIYDGYAVLVSGNGSYTGRVGFYKGKFDLYQRTYACVLDEDEHNISFFYYTLRYLFQPIYSGGKHGSSIPYIVLGDLADFRFAFNETICTKFVNATKPMFDEQLLRQKEIEALTKQRDELLPLLMNGQATVNSHLWS